MDVRLFRVASDNKSALEEEDIFIAFLYLQPLIRLSTVEVLL